MIMRDEQILDASKHCTFDYIRGTPYCRICPYEKFENLCVKILRSDIIKFIERAIDARKDTTP